MPPDSPPQPGEPPAHFDPAALRHDLFDSLPALLNVLQTFQPWLDDMRAQLRAAVNADTTQQLARTAHTLRGGLAQLRAKTAVERVRQLESICKASHAAALPPDHPCLVALEAEFEALSAEIAQFLASAQSGAPPQ